MARVLGEGAYGRVLLARDQELQRMVAVKLLLAAHLSGDDTARPRFLREARLLGKLQHPNVTELYDFGVAEDQPYMVTRYVDGPELRAYLKRRKGGLGFGEAATVLEDVLAGLGAAHAAGVVHRDLKPANVLLTLEGRAVVADFGLGRAAGETTLTQTGTMVGSPIYMCRQQMQGEAMHPSWDVYAAALLFCEMATGKIPGAGRTMTDVYQRRLVDLQPQLVGAVEGLTPAHEAVITACLRQDLRARVPDAGTFLEQWRAASRQDLAQEESYRGSLSVFVDTWSSQARPAARATPADTTPAPRSDAAAEPAGATAPPAAEEPRSGRKRALFLALAAGVVLGLLRPFEAADPGTSPRPPRPPSPAAEAAPRPVDRSRRWARRFELIRRAMVDDEVVRGALALPAGMTRPKALPRWQAGRQQYRALAAQHGLAELVAEVAADGRLERAWYNQASRLHLLQRLLEGRGVKEVGPLFPRGERPGLGELLQRGHRLVSMPTLTRGGADESTKRQDDFARFRARATRWREVRGPESTIRFAPDPSKPQFGVRLTDPFHTPFPDPSRTLPKFLTAGVFGGMRYKRVFSSRQEFGGPLREPAGPFVLASAIENWDELAQIELFLEGGQERLVLTVSPPPELPAGGRSMKGYRQGWALRVARELLPPGLARLRGRLVSLQPMSTLHVTAQVLTILQYDGGPLPAQLPATPP